MEIIPGILEKNLSSIKDKLTFLRGRTKCVQIDFCDGNFVRSQTWPFAFGGFEDYDFKKIINEEEGLPFWNEFDFEFDLMVENAVENFDIYMKLGPKRIIFHLGAQKSIKEFEHFLDGIDLYTRDNVEIGLAFMPDADMSLVSRLAYKVDFLQCMGIDEIGFQNQKFNKKVLENVRFLKKELPGVVLSIDGGVNFEDIESIINAGVNRVVIGSGIWKNPDPIGALQSFQDLE